MEDAFSGQSVYFFCLRPNCRCIDLCCHPGLMHGPKCFTRFPAIWLGRTCADFLWPFAVDRLMDISIVGTIVFNWFYKGLWLTVRFCACAKSITCHHCGPAASGSKKCMNSIGFPRIVAWSQCWSLDAPLGCGPSQQGCIARIYGFPLLL